MPDGMHRDSPNGADLRRHARHCRTMAHAHSDEQVRIILQTMASEFDDQADTADAQGDRKGIER